MSGTQTYFHKDSGNPLYASQACLGQDDEIPGSNYTGTTTSRKRSWKRLAGKAGKKDP